MTRYDITFFNLPLLIICGSSAYGALRDGAVGLKRGAVTGVMALLALYLCVLVVASLILCVGLALVFIGRLYMNVKEASASGAYVLLGVAWIIGVVAIAVPTIRLLRRKE
jgi:hypothetical protein